MAGQPDVSIVMPCLNEAASLEHCITRARFALDVMRRDQGLTGEIVIADNGSTDGSVELARKLGARLVAVERRGYGAALQAGFHAARGRFLVMGDADGSYDFVEAAPMVAALAGGADICVGSRFRGGIAPGAMPWKNRYIGNPVLTGVLNLFFGAGVGDAHCGLRALTRESFIRLQLTGDGMEFASEMLVKAALLKMRIAEAPATLSPDLRGRPPHLRPWRDGWRHLRFLMMLSPGWLFVLPGVLSGLGGLAILLAAAAFQLSGHGDVSPLGDYWTILAGSMVSVSHMALLLGLAAQFFGLGEGYRVAGPRSRFLLAQLNVERMLVSGGLLVLTGLAILVTIVAYWTTMHFRPIGSALPAVFGVTLIAVGVQNAMGGFLLALLSEKAGLRMRMLAPAPTPAKEPPKELSRM